MGNNIKVTVTHEDFENITDDEKNTAIDKKLNLIYRVVSAQQTHCKETVNRLEKKIQTINIPKINKVKAGGMVGGATGIGATIGYLLDKIINALK